MPPSSRIPLAALRVALLYVIACLFAVQVGLWLRDLRSADDGLHAPFPPADAAAAQVPYLGVSADFSGLSEHAIQREVAALAAAGFGWVRVRLAWDAIQPHPTVWQWDATDRVLATLARAGLEPVLVLDGSPAWARAAQDQTGQDAQHAPPADPADFARFAASVATRYAGQARFYQVWDEPNIGPHWGARHIDPAGYAHLLKQAAPALRAADPDAVILLAALAPTADRGHTAQDEVYFLQRLYAAGAAPYFDAAAVQPYGFGTRPTDPRQGRDMLNFRRAVRIRHAMQAAGDGATPVWLVRYGWSRSPSAQMGAVTPVNQMRFAVSALDIAYNDWPWVAAQGWAVHAPAAAPDDPRRGFTLTPTLLEAFSRWSHTRAARSHTGVDAPAALVLQWLVLLAGAAVIAWRAAAALRLLPWPRWGMEYRGLPLWQQALPWIGLAAVYYLATWPPLILLCWVLAACLILARPALGPALALALLPFYFQHKAIQFADWTWTVPPAAAALICTVPALWGLRRDWRWQGPAGPYPWLGLAVGWAGVALVAAPAVWHWPAYVAGFLDFVVVPLALFALILYWRPAAEYPTGLTVALFAGGVLLAVAGLASWLAGGGTTADGFRRLVGPTFSPNHTALYLVRSLFLGLGLAAAGDRRMLAWSAVAVAGVALLLTGSRGALLLGIPAGLLTLLVLRPVTGAQWVRVRRQAWPFVGAAVLGLAVLVWPLGQRLGNVATVHERLELWRLSVALWRDVWAVGVGPGGFYWRFPAYVPAHSLVDPDLRHPHNLWLESATQGGLAGIAWLSAALVIVVRWLIRARATLAWPQVGLVAGLASGLAHGLVDAFFALPDLAAWNWSALALLLLLAATGQQKAAASQDSGSSIPTQDVEGATPGSGRY